MSSLPTQGTRTPPRPELLVAAFYYEKKDGVLTRPVRDLNRRQKPDQCKGCYKDREAD